MKKEKNLETRKMSKIKERPILMQGDMVRATLASLKTQTRRVIKAPKGMKMFPDDSIWWDDDEDPPNGDGTYRGTAVWECDDKGGTPEYIGCPYGQPGDRLWVRETFATIAGPCRDDDPKEKLSDWESRNRPWIYRATWDLEQPDIPLNSCWSPSIHMPRRASRILLEITNIRVERVQDISEEDAKAEGVERHWDEGITYYGPFDNGHASPSYEFRRLWDSINGNRIDKKTKERLPYAWNDNPWVWCLEFRKIEP